MMETRDKRAWAIIIVFGIVIGYFSLAWAGVVPDDYNIVTHYFGEIDDGGNTTVLDDQNDYSQVVINGIPEHVDLAESTLNTYDLTFVASEGVCQGMIINIDTYNTMSNATISLSAPVGTSWSISGDNHTATYIGVGLIPYESVHLTLTVSGDEFTRQGSMMVVCTSNGYANANTGVILITN